MNSLVNEWSVQVSHSFLAGWTWIDKDQNSAVTWLFFFYILHFLQKFYVNFFFPHLYDTADVDFLSSCQNKVASSWFIVWPFSF